MIKRHYEPKNTKLITRELEDFEILTKKRISTIRKKNGGTLLGRSINNALDAFATSIVLQQDNKRTLSFVTIAKEFCVANFAFVMRIDETFPVNIGGEKIELTGSHKTEYVDSDTWLKAFFSAVILRDEEAIGVLREVDETVFLNSNLKPDSFDLHMVNLLQGLFTSEADIANLLENALIASNPDNLDKDRLLYAGNILLPLLSVYRCIFSPDAEADYSAAMRDAVEKHKAFWKKDEYEKQGWISLPLIAAAVFAYDYKGYQLNFETDYIPNWLVKHEF